MLCLDSTILYSMCLFVYFMYAWDKEKYKERERDVYAAA